MKAELLLHGRSRMQLAVIALVWTSGCSSTTTDEAGNRMNTGISEARSGLNQTQTGLGQIRDNSRSSGLSNINTGMNTMDQGVTDMHSGMNMMPSGMMMNCMVGGSSGMMSSMQQAMDEMRQGQIMFDSDASPDDTDAIAHMSNGQAMMGAALDEAQSSMNCMGHKPMMSGGGMM